MSVNARVWMQRLDAPFHTSAPTCAGAAGIPRAVPSQGKRGGRPLQRPHRRPHEQPARRRPH
eukprot:365042-Chlamydomonas_euryale.AAC.6